MSGRSRSSTAESIEEVEEIDLKPSRWRNKREEDLYDERGNIFSQRPPPPWARRDEHGVASIQAFKGQNETGEFVTETQLSSVRIIV